jgi:predicted dehydrogenase
MKLDDVRIVAVADPAEHWDLSGFYYKGTAGRLPVCDAINQHYSAKQTDFKVAAYADFRECLVRENVDAVLCATPDHLHAFVSLNAMRSGKHVYCEKPLTHNIAEARLVAKVAKETSVATQMGNQGHSSEGIRQTCEWIWAGAIGEVQRVHAWVPATRWNPTITTTPTRGSEVPSGLDWDLWCGPRVPPEFHSVYAPVSWRDFWKFGCGAMGDFGCHDLDSAVWALDLQGPSHVQMSAAGPPHPEIAPYGEIGFFDFPPNNRVPSGVRVHWYSGGLMPPRPAALGNHTLPRRGVMFEGTKGVMVCGGAGGPPVLYPTEARARFVPPTPSLARSRGHHRDWIDAIKGGRLGEQGDKSVASSHFEYGARLTEITLLGVLALRTGQVIEWDAKSGKVLNSDLNEELIHGSYRTGWSLA